MALFHCRPMRPNADSQTVNDLGEPDAGNPPVRFDEGRGVVSSRPRRTTPCLLYRFFAAIPR